MELEKQSGSTHETTQDTVKCYICGDGFKATNKKTKDPCKKCRSLKALLCDACFAHGSARKKCVDQQADGAKTPDGVAVSCGTNVAYHCSCCHSWRSEKVGSKCSKCRQSAVKVKKPAASAEGLKDAGAAVSPTAAEKVPRPITVGPLEGAKGSLSVERRELGGRLFEMQPMRCDGRCFFRSVARLLPILLQSARWPLVTDRGDPADSTLLASEIVMADALRHQAAVTIKTSGGTFADDETNTAWMRSRYAT